MKKLSQKEWIAITAGVVVVISFFYFGIPLQLFGPTLDSDVQQNLQNGVVSEVVTESGLKIRDVIPGTGDVAVNGQVIVVHYVGRLEDGTQFDSSVSRGQPFAFVLGEGSVIQGWEEGILGMRVGGRRVLTIPPELGYGERGTGNIPPNATLIFEVTLLNVLDESELR